MTQIITDKEGKEYHLKKLYVLSIKSIDEIPRLEEPNYEQKQWFDSKMRSPSRSWNTCIEHKTWILRWHYFVLGDYE